MGYSSSEKRPWLAAVLAALVTGFGHLYLGRWRRALGWLAVVFAVGWWFVPPEALEALTTGNAVDPTAIAPTLLVGFLSVADAYFVARAQNARVRATAPATDEGGVVHCPKCGKEVDPAIDFCQWCSTPLDGE